MLELGVATQGGRTGVNTDLLEEEISQRDVIDEWLMTEEPQRTYDVLIHWSRTYAC